ncbi:unnamed protein product [Sphenostylis stenocarpa]|uniref:Uncharacterized protein n=1 Tax=Sphenostylis stenocarpa TaxID=92480 RepID=A0AA86VXV2_9FABA|nr:unnamed protein product [Sphenostylis stenocarpa]
MPESTVVATKLSSVAEMTFTDQAASGAEVNEDWGGVGSTAWCARTRAFTLTWSTGITVLKWMSPHRCYDGRVELAKPYYKALTASVRKHFKGNAQKAKCEEQRQHVQARLFGASKHCVGSFLAAAKLVLWCTVLTTAMGNFIHPDWDIFQSDHACAEFQASSRAISGGPIYVSDSVGKHNLKLLKKLVLPDGSILWCQHYALPTRDCLLVDPMHGGKTMLKIWSFNKFSGVWGLSNCQGGGWCPVTRRNKSASDYSQPVARFANDKLKLLKYTESVDSFSSSDLTPKIKPTCSNWVGEHAQLWGLHSFNRI